MLYRRQKTVLRFDIDNILIRLYIQYENGVINKGVEFAIAIDLGGIMETVTAN